MDGAYMNRSQKATNLRCDMDYARPVVPGNVLRTYRLPSERSSGHNDTCEAFRWRDKRGKRQARSGVLASG